MAWGDAQSPTAQLDWSRWPEAALSTSSATYQAGRPEHEAGEPAECREQARIADAIAAHEASLAVG